MKCDGLNAYKADVTIPVYGTIADAEVYLKDKADEAIAELKAENERLKDKLRHYPMMAALIESDNKEIRRLKDELDAANNQCENLINSATDIMLRQDKANDAKCDEIESLKATHYTEMVEAGMENRRLKRAMYKACANWAACKSCLLDYVGLVIHAKMWERTYNKCLKKAEEYK